MGIRENTIVTRRRLKAAGAASVAVCLLLAAASCSKVTKENYDRLKIGMEYSEVVDILGNPGECSAVLSIRDCTWGDDDRSINVKMVGDEVFFISSKGL